MLSNEYWKKLDDEAKRSKSVKLQVKLQSLDKHQKAEEK